MNFKKLLFFCLCIYSNHAISQTHEINAGVGFSYYMGELNHSNLRTFLRIFPESLYFNNYRPSYSIGYRYNFKDRFSFGLNGMLSHVTADDKRNEDPVNDPDGIGNQFRNLNFNSIVYNGFVDVKFEPFRTNQKWLNSKMLFSPYIGLGIGIMNFNPKTSYNGVSYELQPLGTEGQGMPGYEDKYSLWTYIIPASIGIKVTPPSRQFSVSIDLYGIYTGTDYLDDVSNTYADKSEFTNTYGPNSINYLLADRTGEIFPGLNSGKGDARGLNSNNDGICAGQIKFSWYFNPKGKDVYYKCCSF